VKHADWQFFPHSYWPQIRKFVTAATRTPDYGIKLDQRTPNGSTPDSAPGSDRFGPAEQFCSLHLQAMAMPGLEVYQSVDYIEVGLLRVLFGKPSYLLFVGCRKYPGVIK
jgi:hypothetical protein